MLHDITIKYMCQHATMVNYFMCKEMSQNGWFNKPAPSYPDTNGYGTDEHMNSCSYQDNNDKSAVETSLIMLEEPNIVKEMLLRIKEGQSFKK